MTVRSFHTITLGCKLNQFDSAGIEGELARRGFATERDWLHADVVVLNTCTVTGKADAEARKIIRQVRRGNRRCRLLVTGCYAEREAKTLEAIPGVDRVFGNREKPRVAAILDELGLSERGAGSFEVNLAPSAAADRGCEAHAGLPDAVHFGERSRAFLKVQEGCDLTCSYCVIPGVRGRSRSVPPARLEAALDRLLERGYREVVLTGVNTGDYGRDLDPRLDLDGLLQRLIPRLGGGRLRLNSLEPRTITDAIVDRMSGDRRLAPHLQVPLQSGSDDVLRRMRRNYRTDLYRDRVEALRRAVPDVGLGADVIVGFPGESDSEFEDTYRFIAESPLNYLHVFAWSPRPGTPAALMPGRVHGERVRKRSARLRRLADDLGLRFRRRFIGRTLEAVILGTGTEDGTTRALTGNFIEVEVAAAPPSRRGSLAAVRVEEADPRGTRAVWLGKQKTPRPGAGQDRFEG